MPQNPDLFVRAGKKFTRKDLLGAVWPVYKDVEVERTENDIFIYAPFRPPPLTAGRVHAIEDSPRDENLDKIYAPLRDAPDLYLRFARLARKGDISTDNALGVVSEWATTYGVLGVESLYHREAPRPDYPRQRRESLASFTEAVREAAKCLELYEAATVPDDRSAEAALKRHRASGSTLQEKREWAFTVAGDIVGDRVQTDCYPLLYRAVENG